MKTTVYTVIALFLTACTQATGETDTKIAEDQTELTEKSTENSEPIRAKRDSIHTEMKPETPVQMATFNGSWFQIEYPNDFTASPTTPISTFRDYTYVETDEARFTSPDGTVEFFVFSPQWGGDPIDYLIEKPSEKTISQSEDKANSDDPFSVSHHWVTYEDKEGKYTRSYHSQMTESTHLVFGVKYTNRKMYERHKAAYLAFKKSLQQFAD